MDSDHLARSQLVRCLRLLSIANCNLSDGEAIPSIVCITFQVIEQPKERRRRIGAHEPSVRLPKRQFALPGKLEHVEIGGSLEVSVRSQLSPAHCRVDMTLTGGRNFEGSRSRGSRNS
jgi:hypothetical protein